MRNYYKKDMINLIKYIKDNPSNKKPETIYNNWFRYENDKLSDSDKKTLDEIKIFREKLKGKSELVLFLDGRQSNVVFELAQTKYFSEEPYFDFNKNSFIHSMRINISHINDLFVKYEDDKYMQIYKHEFGDNELIIIFGAYNKEDDIYDKYTLSDVIRKEELNDYDEYIDSSLSNPYIKVFFKNSNIDFENGIKKIEEKIKERNK